MDKAKLNSEPNPIDKAGLLSKATFWWLHPIITKSFKRPLEREDLFQVQAQDESLGLGNIVGRNWEKEVSNAKIKGQKPSYIRALIRSFGFSYFLVGLLACVEECILRIVQPLCLGGLIRYFNNNNISEHTTHNSIGVLFALCIALSSWFYICTHHPFFYGIQQAGMRIRISSCSLIYRKALRLSTTALGKTTVGQMVNLLSNDVNRFDQSVIFLHYLWIGPLQTLIVTVILWQELGPSCIAGIILLILFVPFQSWMGKVFSRLRLATAHRTDERIRIMNEVINAMRVIKMYAWEKPFDKMIQEARRLETKVIMKTNYFRALNMTLFFTSSKVIVFLALLVYVATGNILTAEKVFVTSSLINNVRLSMTLFFPFGIAMGSETLISCRRIQDFLEMEEKEECNKVQKSNLRPKLNDCSLETKGICARWDPEATEDTLNDVSFSVRAGQMIAVVGAVGSGKSSLLHAILSELPVKKGLINIQGKLAYSSQVPWLFSGSVKQNILFGQPYQAKRYNEVIKVCALERDLEILPDGDRTPVGERGVSLSGGQKARISLARAVYFDADIYLLDDPLSAVDSHVGKHLYEKCLCTFLKNKVRILVTHQLQFLKTASQILILDHGRVQALGSYYQLKNEKIDFDSMITENEEEQQHQQHTPVHTPRELTESQLISKVTRLRRDSEAWMSIHGSNATLQETGVDGNTFMVASTVGLGGSSLTLNSEDNDGHDDEFDEKKEVGTETKTTGSVKGKIYMSYMTAAAGIVPVLFLVVLNILTQILYTGSDYWLSYWTNQEQLHGNLLSLDNSSYYTVIGNHTNYTVSEVSENLGLFTRDFYVYIYSGMTVGLFILSFGRTVLFFVICITSSKNLHNRMLSAIIKVPIEFFDKHPIGQILNRFTKDLGQVDDLLPPTLFDFLSILLTFLGIMVIITYVNYWVIFPTILLAGVFVIIRRIYLKSARDIKRLEGITRSPVFTHLSTSFQGLTTIRAFEAQDAFSKEFDIHQDLHSSAWFLFLCTTRLFGICLDILSCVYITIVTFSFIGKEGSVLGGDVGLAISSAMMLTGMFQWGVRQSAEVENQMTSVERVLEYSNLEPETSPTAVKESKESGWPHKGEMTFENVSLQYDKDDPPVLSNLTFTIKPGNKIGIVGRTGAGKSSLLTCLFRLTQPQGRILIDGVDTDTLPLDELRKSISIIPQDPTLFNGTVRQNLDPFSEYSDEQIWNALQEVQLKEAVSEMVGKLSAQISEGGSNLSVGQRQLVCLARAILKHNKVLVMDEATANVDPQTDNWIQETIRTKFIDCTVLTIAHRLHTIMDSDMVMVMEAGKLKEFDEPHTLLEDDSTIFSHLVSQTGSTTAFQLKRMAKEVYYKKRNLQLPAVDDESKFKINNSLIMTEKSNKEILPDENETTRL